MKFLEKAYAAPLLTFALTLAAYLSTLAPDVTFTDSGELAAVAATLGVAHPTGYPLFTLLGHLWTLLPLPGTVIYRMNLFAAICTAASAGMFAALARNFLLILRRDAPVSPYAILASALLYGFAVTIWEQSASVEVYSLQLLLFTSILLVFAKAVSAPAESKKLFILWAFLLGLGFTNHGTTILMAPASIFLFFWRPSGGRADFPAKFRTIALLALPFVVGLSVWLYLPLRSSAEPLFNWGGVHRGFDKFWYHASGKQFQVWMFQTEKIAENLRLFLSLLPQELGWLGFVGLIAGIGAVWKSSRRLLWGILLLIAGCLAYSLTYTIHDIEAYFTLAIIAILLLTAAGFEVFSRRKERYIIPALFAPAAIALVMNYGRVNQRENLLVPEYTRILTENLEPNAVILSHQWDFWCSAFWYKQQVEGYRKDVALVETELLRRTWYAGKVETWHPDALGKCAPYKEAFLRELEKFESEQPYDAGVIQARYEQLLNAYIDSNYTHRPVYVTPDVIYSEPAVATGYIKIPQGFAIRLVRVGDSIPGLRVNAAKIDISAFASSLHGSDGHLAIKIREIAIGNLKAIAEVAARAGDPAAAAEAQAKAEEIRKGIPRKKKGRKDADLSVMRH